jgi:hypothetical protein
MCCRVYFIFQDFSRITYTMSKCAAAFSLFLAGFSNFLHYVNMCEAVSPFFRTGLVLPTLYQHVQQRLLHFSELVSYYLYYINMIYNGYVVLQNASLITYNMSNCDAAGIPATITYYLQYVNRFCSGYFILQHWSRITKTLSTCAVAVISFFSIGLVLPRLWPHVLQRLIHFRALDSYYLHYVNLSCSVYFNLQKWSRIMYTMPTRAEAFTSFSALGSYYLEYVNMFCSD